MPPQKPKFPDAVPQQLLGHLLGVLEDDEQQWVEARLEHDVEYCRQWNLWRRRLAPLERLRPDYEPPRGLADRACRFVAAFQSAQASRPTDHVAMRPVPMPPNWIARFRIADASMAALLFLCAAVLILPAIHNSRFHARLDRCQDGLRQFGSALVQSSQQQGSSLVQAAASGRLHAAGLLASPWKTDGLPAQSQPAICPDAWLAVNGSLQKLLPANSAGPSQELHNAGLTANLNVGQVANLPEARQISNLPHVCLRQSYGDRSNAPLASDASGLTIDDHGGRNVLFDDGRVRLIPCAATRDSADLFFVSTEASPAAEFFLPSIR